MPRNEARPIATLVTVFETVNMATQQQFESRRWGGNRGAYCLAAVVTVMLSGASSAQPEKTPTIDECLLGAMATRRAIQSADIEVSIFADIRDSKPAPKYPQMPWRWVLSGNKVLNKRLVPVAGEEPRPQIDCRNCQTSASMSQWSPVKGRDGNWVGLMVGRVGGEYKPTIFDPRVLGVSCSSIGVLHAATIEGFRENLMKGVVRSSITVQPDGLLRISLYKPEGQERHVVMSGPPAFRVASYEVRYSSPPGKPPAPPYTARISVDSVEVSPPVYWFPRRLEYKEESGAEVIHHEVCDVAVHSVNQPIPSSTFDISNFDLPAGVRVMGLPNSGPKVWDGTKLVDESLYSPPRPAAESVVAEKARTSRWWSWVAYALLAIGAAAFIRFLTLRWRARGAQP